MPGIRQRIGPPGAIRSPRRPNHVTGTEFWGILGSLKVWGLITFLEKVLASSRERAFRSRLGTL